MRAKSGYSLWSLLLRSIVVFCPLMLFVSCGGKHSITNPPPVSAQQSYSNASLNGSYAISGMVRVFAGPNASACCTGGIPIDANVLDFDGAGNIVGGAFTYQLPTDPSINGYYLFQEVAYNVSGTYSLEASGSGRGTASITFTGAAPPANPALAPGTYQFNMEVAQQGATVILSSIPPSQPTNAVVPNISITGFKTNYQ